MPRIDLHTHSAASPDGALTIQHYAAMLASGRLNYIAVTDHDRIDFALALQSELGKQIIVGEEITTTEGEIIGLFLQEAVPEGLSAREAAERVREQGGLVYIPHPFETVRKGISPQALTAIADLVDIVETYNGRSLQNRGKRALVWAQTHHKATATSSDAHGPHGWGKTCSVVDLPPTRTNLVHTLQSAAHDTRSVGLAGRLYPKYNRLRKRTGGKPH